MRLTLNEFLEKAGALFRPPVGQDEIDRLQASLNELQATIAQRESDLATAKQTIGTLSAERDTANGTVAAKEKEISDLKAAAKTADELAAEKAKQIVAAAGFPVAQLPTGTPVEGSKEAKIEALQKQLAEEKDPAKKYDLSAQLSELKWGTPAKK